MKPCAFALAIFVAVTTSLGEKRESWILNAPRAAKWDPKIASADEWVNTGNGIGTSDRGLADVCRDIYPDHWCKHKILCKDDDDFRQNCALSCGECTDLCDPNPCENGGTCQPDGSCICPPQCRDPTCRFCTESCTDKDSTDATGTTPACQSDKAYCSKVMEDCKNTCACKNFNRRTEKNCRDAEDEPAECKTMNQGYCGMPEQCKKTCGLCDCKDDPGFNCAEFAKGSTWVGKKQVPMCERFEYIRESCPKTCQAC